MISHEALTKMRLSLIYFKDTLDNQSHNINSNVHLFLYHFSWDYRHALRYLKYKTVQNIWLKSFNNIAMKLVKLTLNRGIYNMLRLVVHKYYFKQARTYQFSCTKTPKCGTDLPCVVPRYCNLNIIHFIWNTVYLPQIIIQLIKETFGVASFFLIKRRVDYKCSYSLPST